MPFSKTFSDNSLATRSDFQRCVVGLFEPLVPYLQRQGAALDLDEGGAHFDMKASSLEGIARPLWGLVPLALGGGAFEHWPLLRRIIVDGSDPDHPQFWGATGDIDQRSCEMAAIALFLALLPDESWHPLAPREKDNLTRWLAGIQGPRMPANNWLFFTVLVQQALKAVGRGDLVDTAMEAAYLDRLSHWYRGDGWYGDGQAQTVDHYGGFAMHFYGLLYGLLTDQEGSQASLFQERAEAFAEPFSYWFAADGDCLAQGRSLTYRFATAAFWGMLPVAGLTPLPIGQIKGLWARQIRSWRNKPIFTADGLLSRGYAYPNLVVCETYNSPTSPYWAMKAFFPLMLPEGSPFWAAEEEPVAYPKTIYPMPASQSIAQRVDGHSIVHYAAPVHRKVQSDKYNKFAYSTCFGMEVNSLQYSENTEAPSFGDNILAFSFDDGANWQMRQHNETASVDGSTLKALWRSGRQTVETTIDVLDDGCCTRTHVFVLDRPAIVVHTGFAVDRWYEEAEILAPDAGRAAIEPELGASVIVKGANGISAIRSLDGHGKEPRWCGRTHGNVVSARTVVPFLMVRLPAGSHRLVDAIGVCPTSAPGFTARFSARE
ncbi:DUF2264 domain-containing protein [Consotaella aegiceratis]|uniref:DUF2264 domain-containing protein n=1 Tax=Consotaella aegiceratis TaxID=3097961 RepID=UPI002F405749